MRVVSLLLGVLILSSCASHRAMPSLVPSGVVVGAEERGTLLKAIKAVSEEVRTLRALALVQEESGSESSKFREAVVFVRPNKLRVETLPTQGVVTLGLLISNAGKGVYLDPTSKVARVGADSSELVRRYLKIPVNDEDLMSLFVGRVPSRFLEDDDIEVLKDSSESIVLRRGGGAESFLLNGKTKLLKVVELSSRFTGSLVTAITYDDSLTGTPKIPSEFTVSFPRANQEIHSRWQNVRVNTDVPETLFQVSIPSDYERIGH